MQWHKTILEKSDIRPGELAAADALRHRKSPLLAYFGQEFTVNARSNAVQAGAEAGLISHTHVVLLRERPGHIVAEVTYPDRDGKRMIRKLFDEPKLELLVKALNAFAPTKGEKEIPYDLALDRVKEQKIQFNNMPKLWSELELFLGLRLKAALSRNMNGEVVAPPTRVAVQLRPGQMDEDGRIHMEADISLIGMQPERANQLDTLINGIEMRAEGKRSRHYAFSAPGVELLVRQFSDKLLVPLDPKWATSYHLAMSQRTASGIILGGK